MSKSLKERYELRKLAAMQERAQAANKQLLKEIQSASLIIEAMDKNDLKVVTGIIDKLQKLKVPGMDVLSGAVEQAVTEINKYTAGGPLTAAWTKLKGMVGLDNPVVKIATFANALEQGFSQIPTIIKNNLGDVEKVNKKESLAEILPQVAGQVKGKLKIVTDQILKSLSPGGVFGAFKKVPYVDTKALVQELINVPVETLLQVSNAVASGPQTSDVAADIKDQTTGKAPEGAPPAEKKGEAEPTAPEAVPAAEKEKPKEKSAADHIVALYKQHGPALSNIIKAQGTPERRAQEMLKFLANNGLLNI